MKIFLQYLCLIGLLVMSNTLILLAQYAGGTGESTTSGIPAVLSSGGCSPTALPQFGNVALGGTADGHSVTIASVISASNPICVGQTLYLYAQSGSTYSWSIVSGSGSFSPNA